MAPIGLVLFIASMGLMEGKGADSIQDKFKTVSLQVSSLFRGSSEGSPFPFSPQMYVPAILANWTVWPCTFLSPSFCFVDAEEQGSSLK